MERVAKMTTPKFHCKKCKDVFNNTIWTYMKYQSIILRIDNPKEIAINTIERVVEAIMEFSPETEGTDKND